MPYHDTCNFKTCLKQPCFKNLGNFQNNLEAAESIINSVHVIFCFWNLKEKKEIQNKNEHSLFFILHFMVLFWKQFIQNPLNWIPLLLLSQSFNIYLSGS